MKNKSLLINQNETFIVSDRMERACLNLNIDYIEVLKIR